MSDDSNQGLIRRAVDGDGKAFACLVERHYEAIYRFAYRWCANQADAEDVTQDVCIKLGQAIRGFTGSAAFSTWLYRITLNAVRDMQRSRARTRRNLAAMAVIAEVDTAAGPEEPADSAGAIWQAVRRLPDRQRDAVLLVYGEGHSHGQAAAIIGCAETTVSWHIHAAKKRLKGLLAEQVT